MLNDNGLGAIRRLGIYLDNLALDPTGTTPDVTAAGIIAELLLPSGSPSTYCVDDRAYDVPDIVHPSTHSRVGFTQVIGDSTMWLCTDTSTDYVAGRSYFSTSSIARRKKSRPMSVGSPPCQAMVTYSCCCDSMTWRMYCSSRSSSMRNFEPG